MLRSSVEGTNIEIHYEFCLPPPPPFSTLAVTNEQPLRHITASRFFKRHTAFSPSLTPLLPPMPVVRYILSTLRRKRESEEEERKSKREEKKRNGCTFNFYNSL